MASGWIRGKAADAKGRQRLARYMICCPFALEKVRYDRKSGMVIYRSRLHATVKRNYQLIPALKWLRLPQTLSDEPGTGRTTIKAVALDVETTHLRVGPLSPQ